MKFHELTWNFKSLHAVSELVCSSILCLSSSQEFCSACLLVLYNKKHPSLLLLSPSIPFGPLGFGIYLRLGLGLGDLDWSLTIRKNKKDLYIHREQQECSAQWCGKPELRHHESSELWNIPEFSLLWSVCWLWSEAQRQNAGDHQETSGRWTSQMQHQ